MAGWAPHQQWSRKKKKHIYWFSYWISDVNTTPSVLRWIFSNRISLIFILFSYKKRNLADWLTFGMPAFVWCCLHDSSRDMWRYQGHEVSQYAREWLRMELVKKNGRHSRGTKWRIWFRNISSRMHFLFNGRIHSVKVYSVRTPNKKNNCIHNLNWGKEYVLVYGCAISCCIHTHTLMYCVPHKCSSVVYLHGASVFVYALLWIGMNRDMQNMYAIHKNNYDFHHQLNTIRFVLPITRHFKLDACTECTHTHTHIRDR